VLALWDRDCGFCAWALATVLRADRKRIVRTAAIQGPEGDRHLAHMPPEQRLASWHLVDDDGTVHSGGAALTVLLRRLPPGRPLASLTGRAPALTERGYAWIARNRSTLSRPIPAAAKARARMRVQARAVASEQDERARTGAADQRDSP
jgi:predicted DCC family thiol-disulfide oxidoreductase YuxK